MLKEFINRIVELGDIRTVEVGDAVYYKPTDGGLGRIMTPDQVPPKSVTFQNLQALLDYSGKVDFDSDKLIFSILGPRLVELVSVNDPQNDNRQFKFGIAEIDAQAFRFSEFYELEDFIIRLMSQFEATKDQSIILAMLSNLANEHVVQNTDDKFSQSLSVKTGLTTRSNETVENPVTLQPFRTFREVAQPPSSFILRFREQGKSITAALFEGDGGAWKICAVANIKSWMLRKTKLPVIG